MNPMVTGASFTLDEINHSAREMLELVPDGIISFRLLKEVLRAPPADPQLIQAKKATLASKWVRQLGSSQLPDGSWGRFHSQDTKKKTPFRTTEQAIDRAFAIGLDASDTVLLNTSQYILDVMNGDAHITDRAEKTDAWPLLVKFFLAGRLAHIDPSDSELDPFWLYLSQVAGQAFASGEYRLEAEVSAYQELSGIHVPQGFLESQHALWILSSRKLPEHLDHAIVHWIWNKPDGIRYIRAPLSDPSPPRIGYWLRSMNLLSRFRSWGEEACNLLNSLWEQRDATGLWDIGPGIARCVEFPLSDNWRKSINRRLDFSTCLLALLRKYFD